MLDTIEQSSVEPPSKPTVLVRYRNRAITDNDIAFIREQIAIHPGQGRTALSVLLCELWDWRAPGGKLKEYACRDLLLRLEEWGHIKLPPPQRRNGPKKKVQADAFDVNCEPIEGFQDLNNLVLRQITDRNERLLWRALMDKYHYLGEGVMCGEHLLYLAYIGDRVVAALGWGAASLRNPKRDAFCGWSDFETVKQHLHLSVNNLRFLIMPWVRVKNLGSKVLGLNLRRLSSDWVRQYHHPVVLAETFVDKAKFHGTVYKASNWICIGETAGRRKQGNSYKYHQSVKDIYVYRLPGRQEGCE